MATSSKRAYATPRSAAPRTPAPCGRPLLTHTSTGDTQALKARSGSISVGSPGVYKALFEPSGCLWQVWDLIPNMILPLLLFCWGFSFAIGHGVSFLVGSNILLSMVVQQRIVILEFSQEKASSHSSTLELTPKKDVLFIIRDWTAKVEGQEIPGVTGKFVLVVQNEAGQRLTVLPKECTGHSKHLLPTTQEKTLHVDITIWSIPKSD